LPLEPLDESVPAAPPPCDLGSAVRSADEEGEEAPLEADGLLALALGELALELEGDEELAPLDELVAPVEAELELPLTPRAASVCWSSLPEPWIPLDCWNSFTAAWVFGPNLPSAGPASLPAALSFS
jgi:hypothetical protein